MSQSSSGLCARCNNSEANVKPISATSRLLASSSVVSCSIRRNIRVSTSRLLPPFVKGSNGSNVISPNAIISSKFDHVIRKALAFLPQFGGKGFDEVCFRQKEAHERLRSQMNQAFNGIVPGLGHARTS